MTGDVVFGHPHLVLHGRTSRTQPNFNAELNPDVRTERRNADLLIHVSICLQRHDPAGGTGTMRDYDRTAVPVRSWGDTEWEEWTGRYIRTCRDFWNNRFWLRTPEAYPGLDYEHNETTYRCNVVCGFEIETTTDAQGANAVIPVVRVDGTHFFRSHALLYSNLELVPRRYPEASSNFFSHVHEVGHLLGLPHPGTGSAPGCVVGGEMPCYAADPDSVMGLGHQRRLEHAQPWRTAIAAITGTTDTDWVAQMHCDPPQPRR